MREKFIILSALLLSPLCAYGALCPTNTPEGDCWNIPGCQYDLMTGCTECDNDNYCDGYHDTKRPCTSVGDGTFGTSDPGATSAAECYKSINCKKDNDDSDDTCRHYYDNRYICGTNQNLAAHMETTECFWNTRFCSKFNGTDCQRFNDDTGNVAMAHWNLNISKWDVSHCICEEGTFTDTNNRHCSGKHFTVKPDTNFVNFATSNVTYTQYGTGIPEGSPNSSSYHCTSCQNHYYVSDIYQSSNPTDFTYCEKPGSAGIVVCNCEEIPKGWHGTENCSWDADTLTSNPCPKNKCPAGQTTQTTGATSANACEYTNQTKFCDAKGCFTLGGDFDNWDFN